MSTQNNAQVDQLLTNVSNAVVSQGLVADEVLTPHTVNQYTGLIGKYGDEHLRAEDTQGGGRHEYRRVDAIDYSEATPYSIEDHGLEDILTRRDKANIILPFDAKKGKVLGLTQKIQISKELRLASIMTSTTILTNNDTLVGTDQFDDYTGSDPLGVFKDAHQSGISKTGMEFNAAVMSNTVFNVLKYHPQILEKLGFNNVRAGLLSVEEMARALGVEKLIVAKGILNTAKKGQTSSRAQIWNNDLVFYHRPESAGLEQMTLGYKLKITGEDGRTVYTYPVNNPPKSEGIIVEDLYDFVVVDPDSAFLVKNAVA